MGDRRIRKNENIGVFFMKLSLLLNKIQRILKKPPHIIAQRIWQEIRIYSEKYTAPQKSKKWNLKKILKENQSSSLQNFWDTLGNQPFCTTKLNQDDAVHLPSANLAYIEQAAKNALQRKIHLLGTGLISLDTPIDWQQDYKTKKRWDKKFFKSIEYNNLHLPSDVKIPWEISRLQWLMPVAQQYAITQDETYAEFSKIILQEWINDNPYAHSVNWACTMEVAIRIMVWHELFAAFWKSKAWQDPEFQAQFLINLYLHADFTANHLEKSSINGNHYIADAAGLIFAGLFFSKSTRAQKWHDVGWVILTQEITKQISKDGVDYEGSIPYHRLVTEIFYFPALLRLRHGFSIPDFYKNYLLRMADFIIHYSRPDGSIPLLGDADDARLIPFGEQPINDHRYLAALIGFTFDDLATKNYLMDENGEIFWIHGHPGIQALKENQPLPLNSKAFKDGGYYIMRNSVDHIFIDCAPVGLQGQGGHGHNDCLSFEAFLENELILVDSGAYVYTASAKERNYFRSTQAHNTPILNHTEINRFIAPELLWTLHNDAKPELLSWENHPGHSIFHGSHQGYLKLSEPAELSRRIILNHETHSLIIFDQVISQSAYPFNLHWHFANGIQIHEIFLEPDHKKSSPNNTQLYKIITSSEKAFYFYLYSPTCFSSTIQKTPHSPSYGVKQFHQKIKIDSNTQPENYYFITGIISQFIGLDVLKNEIKNQMLVRKILEQ